MNTAVKLRTMNLNLLKTLHSVLQHKSVTRAAEEMNMTQAAVSNNLRKLREQFHDPLVVKDGRALRLTPRAASLLGPLDETMSALARIVVTEPFNPQESTLGFRITAANNISAILMPALAGVLAKEAPKISLQIVGGTSSTPQDLRNDRIDLVIGPLQVVASAGLDPSDPTHQCSAEHIRTERFVCLAKKHHALLKNGITKEQYLAMPHATFFLNLDIAGSIERGFIESNRMHQFDRLLTSDFTVLPLIVASSDLIALVPETIAEAAANLLPLEIFDCPIEIPDLELWSFWNRHRDEDESLRWLRSLVHDGMTGCARPGRSYP